MGKEDQGKLVHQVPPDATIPRKRGIGSDPNTLEGPSLTSLTLAWETSLRNP